MSCNATSIPEFANTTPVTPPTVNKKMKPKAKKIGAFNTTELPHKVANQLNILIPVGIAILWIVNSFDYYANQTFHSTRN